MPVYQIRIPDGRVVRIPAADAQTATRNAAAWYEANRQPTATIGSIARQAAQGLIGDVNSAANVATTATPGGLVAKGAKFAWDSVNNIADLIRAGVGPAGTHTPSAADITRPFLDFAVGPNPVAPQVPSIVGRPRNEPEWWGRTAGEMIPNAFLGSGGLVRGLARIAAPTVGSEVSRYATQQAGGGPVAQTVAQAIGAGAGGAATGISFAPATSEGFVAPAALGSPQARALLAEEVQPSPPHPTAGGRTTEVAATHAASPDDATDAGAPSLGRPSYVHLAPAPETESSKSWRGLIAAPDDEFVHRLHQRMASLSDLPEDVQDDFSDQVGGLIMDALMDPDAAGYNHEDIDNIRSTLASISDEYRQQGGIGPRLADETDGVNEDFKAMLDRQQSGEPSEWGVAAPAAGPVPGEPGADGLVLDFASRQKPLDPNVPDEDIQDLLPPSWDPERPRALAALRMLTTYANDNDAPILPEDVASLTQRRKAAEMANATPVPMARPLGPAGELYIPQDIGTWMQSAANDNFATSPNMDIDPNAPNAFSGANTGSSLAAAIAARLPRSISAISFRNPATNAMAPAALAAAAGGVQGAGVQTQIGQPGQN